MTKKSKKRIFARQLAATLDTEKLSGVVGGMPIGGGGGHTGTTSLCGDKCNVYDDCDI